MGFGSTETKVVIPGMKLKGGDVCPACDKDTLMYNGLTRQVHCGGSACKAVFDAKTGKRV